ncbi:MAG TPA: cyclodeaminase/cyclohydrolase family protein [Streptosporangiaceae bacterium]
MRGGTCPGGISSSLPSGRARQHTPEHQVTIGRIITEVDELRGIALRLAEADADAFTAVTGARTLSQSTEEEKAGRSAAIAQALASAAWPQAQTISIAGMVVDLAVALAAIGNPNVISAAAAAAEAARAACSRAASSSARSTPSRSASG